MGDNGKKSPNRRMLALSDVDRIRADWIRAPSGVTVVKFAQRRGLPRPLVSAILQGDTLRAPYWARRAIAPAIERIDDDGAILRVPGILAPQDREFWRGAYAFAPEVTLLRLRSATVRTARRVRR